MACNCGKTAAKQKFVYTDPKGVQTIYVSEVQARAAQIRNKGGSYTAVAA